MASLKTCIQRAGKALALSDAVEISDIYNALVDNGIGESDAAIAAVTKYLEQVRGEAMALHTTVRGRGGDVTPVFESLGVAQYLKPKVARTEATSAPKPAESSPPGRAEVVSVSAPLDDERLKQAVYRESLLTFAAEASKIDAPKKTGPVNPKVDDLLAAIAKLGGWSREDAVSEGIDPAQTTQLYRVFPKADRAKFATTDALMEALREYGYVQEGATGNDVLELVDSALRGTPVYATGVDYDAIGPQWYRDIATGANPLTPKMVANAIGKALRGERLGIQERALVEGLLLHIDDLRASFVSDAQDDPISVWNDSSSAVQDVVEATFPLTEGIASTPEQTDADINAIFGVRDEQEGPRAPVGEVQGSGVGERPQEEGNRPQEPPAQAWQVGQWAQFQVPSELRPGGTVWRLGKIAEELGNNNFRMSVTGVGNTIVNARDLRAPGAENRAPQGDMVGGKNESQQAIADELKRRADKQGSADMTGTMFGGDVGQTDLMDAPGVDTRKAPEPAALLPANSVDDDDIPQVIGEAAADILDSLLKNGVGDVEAELMSERWSEGAHSGAMDKVAGLPFADKAPSEADDHDYWSLGYAIGYNVAKRGPDIEAPPRIGIDRVEWPSTFTGLGDADHVANMGTQLGLVRGNKKDTLTRISKVQGLVREIDAGNFDAMQYDLSQESPLSKLDKASLSHTIDRVGKFAADNQRTPFKPGVSHVENITALLNWRNAMLRDPVARDADEAEAELPPKAMTPEESQAWLESAGDESNLNWHLDTGDTLPSLMKRYADAGISDAEVVAAYTGLPVGRKGKSTSSPSLDGRLVEADGKLAVEHDGEIRPLAGWHLWSVVDKSRFPALNELARKLGRANLVKPAEAPQGFRAPEATYRNNIESARARAMGLGIDPTGLGLGALVTTIDTKLRDMEAAPKPDKAFIVPKRNTGGGVTYVAEPQKTAPSATPMLDKIKAAGANFGANNKQFTKADFDAADKDILDGLNDYNAGFNPKLTNAVMTKVGYYFEAGLRAFGDIATAMIEQYGPKILTLVRAAYEYMRIAYADFAAQMTSPAEAAAWEYKAPAPAGESLLDALRRRLDDIHDNNGLKRILRERGEADDPATMKNAQELLEVALVEQARARVDKGGTDREIFDDLVKQYAAQPNLNVRSSTSIENQAYSTPAPIAFIAARMAGITKDTTVYEPTAGNGMLLITADQSKSTVNELDATRAAGLRSQGFTPTSNDAVGDIIEPGIVDRVIANPPFGRMRREDGGIQTVRVDGFALNAIDHVISAKALAALKPGGKATLILGARKEAGAIGGGGDKVFFNWLYSRYNVVDHFEVNGDLYNRQGAGWPIRIIQIDGRYAEPQEGVFSPESGSIDRVDTWEALYERANLDTGRPAVSAEGVVNAGEQATDVRQPAIDVDRQGGAIVDRSGVNRPAGGGTVAGGSGGRRIVNPRPSGSVGAVGVGVQPDVSVRGDAGAVTGPSAPAAGLEGPNAGELGGGRGGEPGVEKKKALKGGASSFQVPYPTKSEGPNEAVLVPVNMADAIKEALDMIEEAVGNLDDYVQEKLGYESREEMHEKLMALQIDAIAATIYNFERGKGVIIADQTGVGKGRQAAAIIRYARRQGKTPIFVTAKANLFSDMYGDLVDIGESDAAPWIVNIDEEITKPDETKAFGNRKNRHKGVMQGVAETGELPAGSNMMFMTYSQINQPNLQRDLVARVAENGIFILDESHNVAGVQANIKKVNGTNVSVDTTAGFMSRIINDRPVVYLSATFAKRPDNMPIYYRTDLIDAVDSMGDLVDAVAAGGVPLQTVMSNMLAQSGQLFRRERSFDGISIPTVVDYENGPKHAQVSDQVTTVLRAIMAADRMFHTVFFEFIKQQADAAGGTLKSAGNNPSGNMGHSEFSSVIHNFIRQMLLGLKVDRAVEMAILAHSRGEKPIIALENTMGSFLKEFVADSGLQIGDIVTAGYKDVLERALRRTMRTTTKDAKGDSAVTQWELSDLDPATLAAYNKALEAIEAADIEALPLSPIDYMRNKLTEAGISVSEITGRDLTIDYSGPQPVLGRRDSQEIKDRRKTINDFNSGRLDAMILNAAGSTGLSIHASEHFSDQKQRHMIVAQTMLDVNTLVQMLGRINRTGQVALPIYTLMGNDLPSEKRPLAVAAQKMKSLNANTSANSDSDTSLRAPDMLNEYGDDIAAEFIRENPDVGGSVGIWSVSAADEAAAIDLMKKFTGRMAQLPVVEQERIYADIEKRYGDLIEYLDKTGQNNLVARTLDLKARIRQSKIAYEGKNPDTVFGASTTLHQVSSVYQGKPPTADEVRAAIAEALDGKKPGQIAADIIKARASDTAFMEKLNERLARVTAESENARQVATDNPDDTKLADRADKKAQELLNVIALVRLQDVARDVTESALTRFRIGQRFQLDVGDDLVAGVVVDVEDSHEMGHGSPYAGSKTRITFMVNSGARHITLPLNRLTPKLVITQSADMSEAWLERAFSRVAEGREQRYIATGNLIAGSAKFEHGRIIHFTDDSGNTHLGILLPKKFKGSQFAQIGVASNRPRLRDAKVAASFLLNNPNAEMFSGDRSISIFRPSANRDEWIISVPKANKLPVAKAVKFDSELRGMVGDFYGSGKSMSTRAFGTQKSLEKVIARLLDLTPLYAEAMFQPAITAAGGRPPSVAVKSFGESEPTGEQDASDDDAREEGPALFQADDRDEEDLFQTAHHGSPHDHDGFKTQFINTGEGAQVYGWGLYFSSVRKVAEWYRDNLAPRKTAGYNTFDGKKISDSLIGFLGGTTDQPAYNKAGERIGEEGQFLRKLTQLAPSHPHRLSTRSSRDFRNTLESYMRDQQSQADRMRELAAGQRNTLARGGLVSSSRTADDYDELAKGFDYNVSIAERVLAKWGFQPPRSGGKLYQVEIPEIDEMLDYDKPLSEQPESVKAALSQFSLSIGRVIAYQVANTWYLRHEPYLGASSIMVGDPIGYASKQEAEAAIPAERVLALLKMTGQQIYQALSQQLGTGADAAAKLQADAKEALRQVREAQADYAKRPSAVITSEGSGWSAWEKLPGGGIRRIGTPGQYASWFDADNAAEAWIKQNNPGLPTPGHLNMLVEHAAQLDQRLARELRPSPEAASRALNAAGIPGLTYIGYSSSERNFVVFDDSRIEITAKADLKDRSRRVAELTEAAAKVKAGTMSAAEYDALVKLVKPVTAYREIPIPATTGEIAAALSADKVPFVGAAHRTLKQGDSAGLRLDIPAYTNHGTWVVTVHGPRTPGAAGKRIGYESVSALTDATFAVNQTASLNIAAGKAKAPMATIEGKWLPVTPAEAHDRALKVLNDPAWSQVGMDPERHSYFYDRTTLEPVISATEILQVGPLVLAKNAEYAAKSNFVFEIKERQLYGENNPRELTLSSGISAIVSDQVGPLGGDRMFSIGHLTPEANPNEIQSLIDHAVDNGYESISWPIGQSDETKELYDDLMPLVIPGTVQMDGRNYKIVTREMKNGAVDRGKLIHLGPRLVEDKPGRMTKAEVEAALQPMRDALSAKLAIQVRVMRADEAPPELLMKIPNGKTIGGAIHKGEIYVFYDSAKSVHAARKTLTHELVHYAMQRIFGRDSWNELIDAFQTLKQSKSPEVRSIMDEVGRRYNKLLKKEENPLSVELDEFLAVVGERRFEQGAIGRFIRRFRELLNKGLRALGFKMPLSMSEVHSIISAGQEYVKVGDPKQLTRYELMFSLEEEFPDPGERESVEHIGAGFQSQSRNLIDRFNDARDHAAAKIRQGVVDHYDSFKRILGDERSWMLSHLTKSSAGAMEAAIQFGQLYLDSSGVIGVDTSKKGLQEILGPLGTDITRFFIWIAANRAERLSAEDRENLFRDIDIVRLKASNQNTPENPNREQIFEDVRKDFEAFGHSITMIAVDSGTIDAAEAAQWEQEGFYVPFYRVLNELDEKSRGPRSLDALVRQTAFTRLKGGVNQLGDLLANSTMNWHHLIATALKNQAATYALLQAEAMGIATRGGQEGKDNVVYIRVGGKKRFYTIADSTEGMLVLDSLISLNTEGMNTRAMKAFRWFKRALTAGVTASPEFKIRNLLRDSIHAIAVTDMSTNIAKNLSQGWDATSHKSPLFPQMLAGGAIFLESGYIHGADPDAIKYLVRRGVQRDTILDTRYALQKVWDGYQDFGARLENINRAANYVQSMSNPAHNRLEATFNARDQLDFSRTGSWHIIRVINQTVPFVNARLQGLDKLWRAANDTDPRVSRAARKVLKSQAAQFAVVTGTVAMLGVLLYLSMMDDPDYKQTEEWERDTYWMFKLPGGENGHMGEDGKWVEGQLFRIPKPFEVGAIATLMERFVEQIVDDEAHGALFAERLGYMITQTFVMNPIPQALMPALEVIANRDFFTGRDIETMGMERLSPENRKRAWTSETAIAASQFMAKVSWDKVVLSPPQIEELVRGYFGWAGATVLSGVDSFITRPLTGAPARPSMNWLEMPVLQTFAKEMPPRSTKYTTEFYQNKKQADTAFADLRNEQTQGNRGNAQKIIAERKEELRVRLAYDRAANMMNKHNKAMMAIWRNAALTPDEKRAKLDALNRKKNALAEKIVQKFPL